MGLSEDVARILAEKIRKDKEALEFKPPQGLTELTASLQALFKAEEEAEREKQAEQARFPVAQRPKATPRAAEKTAPAPRQGVDFPSGHRFPGTPLNGAFTERREPTWANTDWNGMSRAFLLGTRSVAGGLEDNLLFDALYAPFDVVYGYYNNGQKMTRAPTATCNLLHLPYPETKSELGQDSDIKFATGLGSFLLNWSGAATQLANEAMNGIDLANSAISYRRRMNEINQMPDQPHRAGEENHRQSATPIKALPLGNGGPDDAATAYGNMTQSCPPPTNTIPADSDAPGRPGYAPPNTWRSGMAPTNQRAYGNTTYNPAAANMTRPNQEDDWWEQHRPYPDRNRWPR